MAKKRKSKKSTAARSHASVARVNRPAPRAKRRQQRYTGRYLTLAIMGGAAFFIIKGCSDSGDADNDGDGIYYSSIQDCINDGNGFSVCTDAWSHARNAFYAGFPEQLTMESCEQQFGNCTYDSATQRWAPMMAGFLLSQAVRKDRDEQYAWSSGGSSYASRPVWRTTSGDYAWRSGTGKSDSAASHDYVTKKAATVSRGGYGRSSSARGHWGG